MQTQDRRALFAPGWQLLCHVSPVTSPGATLACDIAGLPIALLRNAEGRLRAFHNVVRHRAGPLAVGVGCEDRWICEAVQRGLASGSWQPGVLTPRRESAVAHF